MGFAMGEEQRGPVTVIRLSGELDLAAAPGLQARIDDLVTAGRCRIVLELAELTFCDSAGLNTFIRGDRQCTRNGGWLRLAGADGHVGRVLKLSGVAEAMAYRGSD